MKAALAPLTAVQRAVIWAVILGILLAGAILWDAYGLPVALLSAFLLC
ncbi:hypothetical protein [Paracoccus sp. PAR01]|nr:hypothetical protein [Paracoccus sp. PAR01]MBD9528571.1 hypothetical protein [Paracoccus sp. PAR01]